MRRVSLFSIAGTALFLSSAAMAADLPLMLPPPVVEDVGGWYLRGDIGMSNQSVKNLYNVLYDDASITGVTPVGLGFDSAPIFGLGFGYQFNNWLRLDVTGEYRGRANFHGLDIVTTNVPSTYTDEYHASKSEWLFLANAYADLGTWYHVTPFVGLGVGGSRNTISSFLDVCTTCAGGGVAYGATAAKWNFAWAVHAGLAFQATRNLTIELAYRYVDLGNAQSGDIITYTGTNVVTNPMHFNDLTSHDVKLGVRWLFDNPAPIYAPPPPLVRKG